jgi:hypothetical protein
MDQESFVTSDPVLRASQDYGNPQISVNKNFIEHISSRPAIDVLRDIIQKFQDLEWLLSDIDSRYPDVGKPIICI